VDSKKFRSIANAAERDCLEISAALQMQRSGGAENFILEQEPPG